MKQTTMLVYGILVLMGTAASRGGGGSSNDGGGGGAPANVPKELLDPSFKTNKDYA